MFIVHFGLAFAAKRIAPRTGLGTLGAASQWVDLLWPVLLLAGVEQVRIAPGETAYTPLAFVHYPWIRINGALLRGLIAALIGGVTAYGLAVIVPGSAVMTALLGMLVGGLIALPIIWSEIKLLLRL